MPKVSRPFDSTSIVASILAVSTARAVRHDRDRGDEPQSRGLAGDKGDRGQLLVPVAARSGRETRRCRCRGICASMSRGITTWSLIVRNRSPIASPSTSDAREVVAAPRAGR